MHFAYKMEKIFLHHFSIVFLALPQIIKPSQYNFTRLISPKFMTNNPPPKNSGISSPNTHTPQKKQTKNNIDSSTTQNIAFNPSNAIQKNNFFPLFHNQIFTNQHINMIITDSQQLIKELQIYMGKNKRDKQKQIEQRRELRKKDRQAKFIRRKKMGSGDIFKHSKEYIQYYQEFENQMNILGLKLRDVGGDGNCLFRAIADHIDGDQNTHMFMRDQACKFIIKESEFFQNYLDEDEDGTVEQYVNGMRKNGQWGGHLQLQALAQCFKCIIVVHKKNMEEYYVNPILNEVMGGIMHLAYFQTQDFQHYLSLRHITDNTNLPAVNQLKEFNGNMYQHLLFGYDPEEAMMMKQFDQMQINDFGKVEEEQIVEPYPNYPKNKKCKCGSKEAYKTCCFKEYQKKLAKQAKKEMF